MKAALKALGVVLVLTAAAMWWGYATYCGVHPHGLC